MLPKVVSGNGSDSRDEVDQKTVMQPVDCRELASSCSSDDPISGEEPGSLALAEGSSDGTTKMSRATEIYRRMTRKKGTSRKEIIAVFMEKVGLTKAGASTYYQMIKKTRRSS